MFCSSLSRKRVFITRHSGLLAGHVGLFSVGIHSFGLKGVRLGRTPGLAERAFLSDKPKVVGQKHSLLPSGDGKIRGGEFRSEVCKVFRSVSASGPASDVLCYEGTQRDECVRPACRSAVPCRRNGSMHLTMELNHDKKIPCPYYIGRSRTKPFIEENILSRIIARNKTGIHECMHS